MPEDVKPELYRLEPVDLSILNQGLIRDVQRDGLRIILLKIPEIEVQPEQADQLVESGFKALKIGRKINPERDITSLRFKCDQELGDYYMGSWGESVRK